MDPRRNNSDLVLPVGQYAFVQDTSTTGVVHVHVGPTVVKISGAEQAVNYDHRQRAILAVDQMYDAVHNAILVEKGQYAILENPASDDAPFPIKGSRPSAELDMGRRVVINGPANFVPWPHQHVELIPGHQLRSNQYLLIRVYDADDARENWGSAVMKPAAPNPENQGEETASTEIASADSGIPADLAEGKLYLVKGTDVSYYIPPTGVEVVPDRHKTYVRDAVTLERLEYCILVDESGDKSFVRGPAVVFPAPTQRFHSEEIDEAGNPIRIFSPIELSPIQGVHLRFIAGFKDTNGVYGKKGREFEEGQEVFITGKDTTIFFPTEHVSFVKYDGEAKSYAVAIPAGDARYVMNRTTGVIRMVKGPAMLLPNPVEEVIVRRILSPRQCGHWYPNNQEVMEYNDALRRAMRGTPSTRAGTVSEGQVRRNKKIRRAGGGTENIDGAVAARSSVSYGTGSAVGDEFTRKSNFTEPRMVTLSGRFNGAPLLNIHTGYAVQIVDKQGNRRVVTGPAPVLLAYDEDLEYFSLSTGKPKTTDRLITDVYLRVANNQVSDVVTVETSDHVKVNLKLSFRCDFTGDDSKWFTVDNYVKMLTDRARSMLRAAVRKESIESFFKNGEAFVRDTILGEKKEGKKTEAASRAGLSFEENGLHVKDVEVLDIQILHRQIGEQLTNAAVEAITLNLSLEQARRQLKATTEREDLKRQGMEVKDATAALNAKLELEAIARLKTETEARQLATKAEHEQQLELQKASDAIDGERNTAAIARRKAGQDQEIAFSQAKQVIELALIQAQTAAFTDKAKAVSGDVSQAIMALGDKQTVIQLAEALKVQTALDGGDFGGTIATVLGGTAIGQKVLGALQAPSNGVDAQA